MEVDLLTASVCVSVALVSAAFVYLGSVFIIKEKTYDEAIEERKQTLLDFGDSKGGSKKNDKSKKEKKDKDKDKKKKKNDDVKSNPTGGNVTVPPVTGSVNVSVTAPVTSTVNVPSTNVPVSKAVNKTVLPKAKSVGKVETVKSGNESGPVTGTVTGSPKVAVASGSPVRSNVSGTVSNTVNEPFTEAVTSTLTTSGAGAGGNNTEKASSGAAGGSGGGKAKPSSKPKGSHKNDSDVLDSGLPTKKLIDQVSNHPFDAEEIQLLINVLLSRQTDGSNQWKKKHDPMEAVKEQLHEKEQEVATLSQNLQATRTRMKELRLDLEREKSAHAMTKEKLAQHGNEVNNLRNSLQQVIEQQRLEAKVLQNKLKEHEADLQNRLMTMQRMEKENVNLKLALQQMDAQKANLENIPLLHNEIDRLRAELAQTEHHSQAIQQTNDELLRNIDKLSEQIQSISTSKQNEEYSLKKKLNELLEQLRQHDSSKAALLDDYKSSVDKCKQIEQEKQMIEKKSEEELNNLRDKLRELEREKNRLLEASNSKASSDEEKDGLISRLKDEINNLNNTRGKTEEELHRVHQAFNTIKEELEQVKKESQVKVNEALTQSKVSFEEKLKMELEKVNNEKESVSKQLTDLKDVKVSLETERDRLKKSLIKVNQQEEDICKSVDQLTNELITLRAEKTDNSQNEQLEGEMNSLKVNLKLEQEKLEKAQAEAEKFKDALSKTDEYLKELEQKSKDAFEQSSVATKECQRLQELVSKLELDKSALERNLSQVDNLKETIKQLQAKNDELQQKLEDNSSSNITSKVVEVLHEEMPTQENGKEETNGKVGGGVAGDDVNDESDMNNDEARLTSIYEQTTSS